MQLGEYLRNLRLERGLSQRESAKRAGLSQSRLAEIEANRSRLTGKPTSPSVEVILKLARFYDQSPGILMEMAGVTPPAADEQLEAQLVHTFRRLNDSQRRLALMLIESIEAHGKSEAHHF